MNSQFDYSIDRTWNNLDLDHVPTKISLQTSGENKLLIKITARFFNSPLKPKKEQGEFFNLWDYEVVEAFFLSDSGHYVEFEFGPHGHYIVILFDRERHSIKEGLKLEYKAEIDEINSIWTGTATIPSSYFPFKVTKWNAYGINRDGESRSYEALFPIPQHELFKQPDFHRINFFSQIDFKLLLPSNHTETSEREVWSNS